MSIASAAVEELGFFAAVEADDVGEELVLVGGEVAMGTVDLAEGVTGVEEQHLIRAVGVALALVEEPQRDGQGDGVEEVRSDRDHDVDLAVLDQLAADRQLGVAGVGSGVGHDEAGAPGVVERRREDLDPEVVAVVGRRDAVRVPLVVLDPVLVDAR